MTGRVPEPVPASDPRSAGAPGDGAAGHPFDVDTALVAVAAGRWRAHVPEHWLVGRGPNGGFLAALATRAAEAATGRPLRSLALHFLAAPHAGPLELHATVERAGRSFSAASVRIEQGGRAMTLALATLGELSPGGAEWDVGSVPDAPAAAQTGALPVEGSAFPAFMRNYDMRPALDGAAGGGGWLRTTEPRRLDAPLAAAMTDAWMPAAFAALGRVVGAPTLDLTIHVRRALPLAEMAPEDHVLVRFRSRMAVGGAWEEDGELWTPGGALIAQSRQLALVRELPA